LAPKPTKERSMQAYERSIAQESHVESGRREVSKSKPSLAPFGRFHDGKLLQSSPLTARQSLLRLEVAARKTRKAATSIARKVSALQMLK
jgi:hypothetical protein